MGFEFTLVLDRVPTDDELDALFFQGGEDALFETDNDESLAHFDRSASSLTAAISAAVHTVEGAGFRAREVRREVFVANPTLQADYAREIAAANLMVQTRAFLAKRRVG
ncbi:MAG: hypothetical protein ACOYD0_10025 [Candidatus Nanopelagicales bacterium]